MFGLTDPRFVAAYGGAEIDPARLRGEIDARATGADTSTQRNKEWLGKGTSWTFMPFSKFPKGRTPAIFPAPGDRDLREVGSGAQCANMARAFRIAGIPAVLPPGTPRWIEWKSFRAPSGRRFKIRNFLGNTDEPIPLLPELHDKAIREIPRAREVVEVFKKLVGAGPLPAL